MTARPTPATAPAAEALSAMANPLAAQSARAALFGLHIFESNLRTWRCLADAMRSAMRDQQDLMLAAARAQWQEPAADAPSRDAIRSDLIQPFVAAQRAYERMGVAVLAAQRNAMEAWAEPERPH